MDLRLAFLLYVALPLLLLVGAAGSLSLGALEEISEKRLKEDLELIGRSLEKPMGRAMARGREGALENALASAFSFGRVYGAYLYDADGQQLAAAGAARSGGRESSELAQRAEKGQTGGEYRKVGGRQVYSFFTPLTDPSGKVNGLLQITRRASEIHRYTHQLRVYGAGGLATLAFILVSVTFLGYRQTITRPLARLNASMQRVASGEHEHRTTLAAPREIAGLARTFNTMLDRMQRDREEIRERRANQQRLKHELQRSEKMASIGRLSAGVAHELGAPLSVIDGTAQRLLRKPDHDRECRQALERVRAQTGRMTEIVNQLLAFGRNPEGNPRPILAERLTRAVMRNARETLEAQDTRIEQEQPEEALWLYMDPFRGEQMLSHLITNAAQATPGGTVAIRWDILDSATARLRVEDDGPGIAPDHRERIFEPFYTTKAPGEGSGLGLAMVHTIAEEHGGQIRATQSELGGAAFDILLPRTAPEPGEGSAL